MPKGQINYGAALALTCSGTSRIINVGDTVNVTIQVKNTGTQTTTFYVTAYYTPTGASTPVLMRYDWTSTSIAPGVTNNFNDSFPAPQEMAGKTIRIGCDVARNNYATSGGIIVTSGFCDGMFTVQSAPIVAAEIVKISVA